MNTFFLDLKSFIDFILFPNCVNYFYFFNEEVFYVSTGYYAKLMNWFFYEALELDF